MIMKRETKDDIKAGSIGVLFVFLIVWALVGCTYTIHKPPMKLKLPPTDVVHSNYQYYVIDENSTVPDAYFISKKDAEKYKEYFKDNHNYVIVELQ